MKLILLAYLVLALFSVPIRSAPVLWFCRCSRAIRLWRVLHHPWRVAWQRACREIAP